jgi:NADP-dependent 3-hydroxy acid dehydrogenase YdfG
MTQRVLVTAGASGIGREIARAFVAIGAKVFVSDIDPKGLEALSHGIDGVNTKVCDNSKRSDVEALIPVAAEALGGLDVLVNNAGISGPTAPVEEMDPDKCEAVMNVDLHGTFNVTRRAIPYLKESPAGSIILMSSLGCRFGYPNRSPYCTSKWGLIGFAKTLALELGEFNIRECDRSRSRRRRANRTCHRRPRKDGRQDVGTGEGKRDVPTGTEAFCRSQRYRSSLHIPSVECGEVVLGASIADRQWFDEGVLVCKLI